MRAVFRLILWITLFQAALTFAPTPFSLSVTQSCPSFNKVSLTNHCPVRRLVPLRASDSDKEEKNEELAFKNLISGLKNLIGRDGFKGKEAYDAIEKLEEVEKEAEETEEWQRKFLGSRRLYRLTKKASTVFQKPVARKNHPGETYNPSRR